MKIEKIIYKGYSEKFKTQINKLNKKAMKLGISPIELKFIEDIYETNSYNQTYVYEKYEIIQKEEVVVEGWEFRAKIERNLENNSFIVSGYDTDSIPSEIKKIRTCQHCNTNRKRKCYYVLQNKNREYKVVGKTCLKDFIGHENAESIANLFSELQKIFGDDYCDIDTSDIGFRFIGYKVREVIKASIVSVSLRGYVKSAETNSTKEHVEKIIENRMFNKGHFKEEIKEMENISESTVDNIIEVVKKIEPKNDFISNILNIINSKYVDSKFLGYLVYLPILAKQYTNNISSEGANEYIGNLGDKVELELTYLNHTCYENNYGIQIFRNFIDDLGNKIIWKTSSTAKSDILNSNYEGEKVLVKGTIKEHKEFRGKKQTYLTRCKIQVKEVI